MHPWTIKQWFVYVIGPMLMAGLIFLGLFMVLFAIALFVGTK